MRLKVLVVLPRGVGGGDASPATAVSCGRWSRASRKLWTNRPGCCCCRRARRRGIRSSSRHCISRQQHHCINSQGHDCVNRQGHRCMNKKEHDCGNRQGCGGEGGSRVSQPRCLPACCNVLS